MKCECEHIAHDCYCNNLPIKEVANDWGTFKVCRECADGHWQHVIRKEKPL